MRNGYRRRINRWVEAGLKSLLGACFLLRVAELLRASADLWNHDKVPYAFEFGQLDEMQPMGPGPPHLNRTVDALRAISLHSWSASHTLKRLDPND